MMQTAYLVEVGILLPETTKDTNPDEYAFYASAYDKQHAYYDENQYYEKSKDKAIRDVKKYVEDGVDRTYGVVSEIMLSDDIDLDNDETYVEGEDYDKKDIVFSTVKLNGKFNENFIQTK